MKESRSRSTVVTAEGRSARALALALCALAAVTWLDFASGSELRLFPLYFVPVSLMAWSFGIRGGAPMAAACTAAWVIANRLAGLQFSAPWLWWGNAATLMIAFASVALLIDAQRRQLLIDSLTGVSNARGFYEQAELALARARRTRTRVSVVVIDLDGFKVVNDTLGHAVGDAVLSSVARALAATCDGGNTVARLGGDEFAVVLRDADAAATERWLRRAQEQVRSLAREHRWPFSLSAGAIVSDPSTTIDALLREADRLMYEVKRQQKDHWIVRDAAAPAELSSAR